MSEKFNYQPDDAVEFSSKKPDESDKKIPDTEVDPELAKLCAEIIKLAESNKELWQRIGEKLRD